jgi:hypothetical protein
MTALPLACSLTATRASARGHEHQRSSTAGQVASAYGTEHTENLTTTGRNKIRDMPQCSVGNPNSTIQHQDAQSE